MREEGDGVANSNGKTKGEAPTHGVLLVSLSHSQLYPSSIEKVGTQTRQGRSTKGRKNKILKCK